jgi:hypothetical protein
VIRLVDDLLTDQLRLSVTGACRRVGEHLDINPNTLRGWVKLASIEAGPDRCRRKAGSF